MGFIIGLVDPFVQKGSYCRNLESQSGGVQGCDPCVLKSIEGYCFSDMNAWMHHRNVPHTLFPKNQFRIVILLFLKNPLSLDLSITATNIGIGPALRKEGA
jgi:hypothetical protein